MPASIEPDFSHPSKTEITAKNSVQHFQNLNALPESGWVDRNLLNTALLDAVGLDLYEMLVGQRPNLFSAAVVFVSEQEVCQQQKLIAAVTKVIAMPAYQQRVLAYAPAIAQFAPKANGVFLGYDFHVSPAGSKLIEINTNAGGALLNALLIRSQIACGFESNEYKQGPLPTLFAGEDWEQVFLTMFRQEWRVERGGQLLQAIAIVDAQPQQQYMLPEFILYKHLFERHGIETFLCDPGELVFRDNGLWLDDKRIDLVYNRHTDFSFESAELQPLAQAYLANAVVVTPHPRCHALYADKRNLAILSDPLALADLGVDALTSDILQAGIARTHIVKPSDAGALWAGRKHLFFKPAKGYGSKAAYRGDKLTQRVFSEILQGQYVAQMLASPGTRQLTMQGQLEQFKWDLRHYVYQGHIQMLAARLYQGQTTNFRTPGGGFAMAAIATDG